MTIWRRPRLLAAFALCAAVFVPAVPATAATRPASPSAQVSVVNGLRGLVADVRVDGKLMLSGFATMRVSDPMALPAGPHRVLVSTAGAGKMKKPVLDTTFSTTAGSQTTLSVGLNSAGTPQITTFDDNLPPAGTGATPLVVRNIAATPPVRITVDEVVLATASIAPQQRVTAVTPGNHTLGVLPAGGASPLLPAQSVPAMAGRSMALYLIGSAKDRSLEWVDQSLGAAAPTSMQAGVGPVDEPGLGHRSAVRLGLTGLVVVGILGMVACVGRARRRHSADTADLPAC